MKKRVDHNLFKICIVGLLVIIFLEFFYYFEFLLKNNLIFVHFFSVAIILATFLWTYKRIAFSIDENKKAKKALQESEERYRQLFEMAPDAIFVHDEERLIFVNPATVQLVCARDADDLIGKPVLDFVALKSREEIITQMQYVLETHNPSRVIETKIIRMDGSLIDIEVIGTFVIYDGKPAIQTVAHDISKRKKAEMALKESEEKYRTLVERANDGIAIVQDGMLKYANPRQAEIVGYTVEELTNTQFTKYIAPDEFPKVLENYNRRMAGEDVVPVYETMIKHKDGSDINVEFNVSIITYQGKKAAFVILRDITERKLAEDALKFNNLILSTQQETSLDGVLILDEKKRVISFNQRFIDMWDIPPEAIETHSGEIVLQSVLDKLADPITFLNMVESVYEHTEEKSQGETLLKDGRVLDHYSAPMCGKDGKYYGRVLYFRDITERKTADEELHAAHQKLMDIIEFLPDATFVIDAEKKVIAWNRAIEEMTGVKKENIIGKGDYAYAVPFYGEGRPILVDLLSIPDSEIKEKYKYIEKKGNSLYGEAFTPSVYGGKGAHLSGKASPLFDASGNQIGAIESIRDITEQKKAEDNLKKYAEELQDSNELKDLFTDILHHDLLNPAGIVKGYAEILSDLEEDEKKGQYLQIIERNNEKLIGILERASKFAKLQSVKELKFKTMDIGVIFKEVIGNFMPRIDEKQMVLEFSANGRYCAKVNPVIEEVFSNLLSNAIKYGPQKSRIIIDITDAGEDWRVSVTDFGGGISDADKSSLFERFRRVTNTDVKGTGLGLAIVRRLITLHGGRVGVEDNPEGQGSRFWVTLKKA